MLHRIIQRPLNTAFDKLYARRAAKFPINPDGVLRVRHPALILISVFISALVGTLLTALIVYMVLHPNTTQTPQQSLSILGSLIFCVVIFYGLAVWAYLNYRNIYVETARDYVEQRNAFGRITRIYYSEVSAYSYWYEYNNKMLTLFSSDGRQVSFRPKIYRGERVLAVLAFRMYNSRWPDPRNSSDQHIVETQAANGIAEKALWNEHPVGKNLLMPQDIQ